MATAFNRLAHDARAHQRFPTRIPGSVDMAGKAGFALICNISEGGARIESTNLPAVGTEIVLRARKLNVIATVIWKSALGYGVRFHEAVRPLEIVRHNYAGLEHLRNLRSVK